MITPYASGLWVGATSNGAPLMWCLVITTSSSFPSAFGASSDGSLLVGSFDATTRILTLRQNRWDDADPTKSAIVYRAREQPQQDEGMVCFAGTATSQREEEPLSFHIVLDSVHTRDGSSSFAGCWVGEATPSPELEPFAIPTNPITFALAVVQPSLDEGGRGRLVFGSGYFDDAADVEGEPVMCFALCAEDSEVKEESDGSISLTLRKRYETPTARHYDVVYRGSVKIENTRNCVFSGRWENRTAMTNGDFRCTLISEKCSVAGLCAHCSHVLEPGQSVLSCCDCPQEVRLCVLCRDKHYPEHKLRCDIVLASEVVDKPKDCADVIRKALKQFSARPFLGRVITVDSDRMIEWRSYADVAAMADAMLSSLPFGSKVPHGHAVLIGSLSFEYTAILLSCVCAGFVVVPLHSALHPEDLRTVLNLVNPSIIFLSKEFEVKFWTVATSTPFCHTTVYDHETFTSAQRQHELSASRPPRPPRLPSDTFAILFTSGSSGIPKGAVYSEALVMPSADKSHVSPMVKLDFQAFHPSYIVSLIAFMAVGGRRVLALDLGELTDVIPLVRPTHLSAPPMLFAMLRREFSKDSNARRVRAILGNRLLSVASGGAPIDPQLLRFCRETLQLQLSDLYGAREAGPIASDGVVYPGVEARLVEGQQLAVHSKRMIEAYFGDPERTAESFRVIDGKRFYLTGDVAEFMEVDGVKRIKLLGRVGYGKMANAEWLEAARIEAVMEALPWVRHALVMGSLQYPRPVAIVVVNTEKYSEMPSFEVAVSDISLWLTHQHIPSSQIPIRIALLSCATDDWTAQNGALTPTFKKARAVLEKRYEDIIKRLFSGQHMLSTLSPNSHDSCTHSAPTLPEIHPILMDILATFGVRAFNSSVLHNLTVVSAGLDSLSIHQFAHALKKQLLIKLPLRAFYQYNIGHLSNLITFNQKCEAETGAPRSFPTLEHCTPSFDINWSHEILCENYDMAYNLTPQQQERINNGLHDSLIVLGASGFFGPHIVRAALIAASRGSTKAVVCIVRDPSRLQLDDHEKEQVVIVAADITKPFFGLTQEEYISLAARSAVIIHNAADVNLTAPYSHTRTTTVEATRQICRFVSLAGSTVRLGYVSSVAVLPGHDCPEDWLIFDPQRLSTLNGYAASKAVSEHLIRSLPRSCVFRCSALVSKVHNDRDFLVQLLRTMKELRICPENATMPLHWVPAEHAARAIIELTLQSFHGEDTPNSSKKEHQRVFHVCGSGPSIGDIADLLHLRRVSLTQWRAAAKEGMSEWSPFRDTVLSLEFIKSTVPVTSVKTREALAEIGISQFKMGSEELSILALSL